MIRVTTLVLVAMGLISWIIFLAGVAAFHAEAVDKGADEKDVGTAFSFHWWVIWYMFLLLILIAIAAIFGIMRATKQSLGLLLAAGFAMECVALDTTFKNSRDDIPLSTLEQRLDVVMAGGILLTMVTLCLMLFIGSIDVISEMRGSKKEEPRNHPPQPASYNSQAPVYHGAPYSGAAQYYGHQQAPQSGAAPHPVAPGYGSGQYPQHAGTYPGPGQPYTPADANKTPADYNPHGSA